MSRLLSLASMTSSPKCAKGRDNLTMDHNLVSVEVAPSTNLNVLLRNLFRACLLWRSIYRNLTSITGPRTLGSD